MNYRIEFRCKDCYVGSYLNVPIPRIGDLVNDKYKVESVSYVYDNGIGTPDTCNVIVYLIENN